MDFDSNSERLSDLNEFSSDYIKKKNQKNYKKVPNYTQVMQMKSVSKV